MPTRLSPTAVLTALFTTLLITGCSSEAMGGLVAGSIAVYVIGGILLFLLVIFALFDLYKGDYPATKKIIWVVIILIVPYIGAILYFIVGKNSSAAV